MSAERDVSPEENVPFLGATIEVVRAIRQRDLLNKWLSLYTPLQHAPPFEDFDFEYDKESCKTAVLYTVAMEHGHHRFMIDSGGTRLAKAYGATGIGRELSEYLGPKLTSAIMPVYDECLRRKLPVYTVSRVQDRNNRKVDFERLLLPFGDGTRITRIMALFETISPDGHFEIDKLMRDRLPINTVRAVIDKNLYFTKPPRIPPRDKIEFE